MRSPIPTPGRNRRLENLWQTITGFVRSIFGGSQRPVAFQQFYGSDQTSTRARNYDLEIGEYPIRDYDRAVELIEMAEWCPEVAAATDILKGAALSSEDGDDQGFTIATELNDGSAIDKQVYTVCLNTLERLFPHSTSQVVLERMLNWGDAFAELAIDLSKNQVNSLMFLPTWEMFRVEAQGELLGFQQRRRLYEEEPAKVFVPGKVVHWRYRRKNLYGRSLFHESPQDWARLKRATDALAIAADTVGYNPNLHAMQEGTTREQLQDYQQRLEQRQADGIITDYYLMPGQDIKKLSNINPDIEALAANVLQWRSRIVMRSRVPPYLLGLPAIGAQEIAGQPALENARHVNEIRMCLTEGVMQVLHTELYLKGINTGLWLNKLKLVFPKIITNAMAPGQGASSEGDPGELDEPGITDLDSTRVPIFSTNGRHH
ncbi:MAG: hypothetical protein KME42_14165 [Tildeniella nuda ZEHNDER 1965/U140]|jgi:hypothetical protein|nr:hypothetical protein [Tildeniella nuda ZEHNDER 1965/U140]